MKYTITAFEDTEEQHHPKTHEHEMGSTYPSDFGSCTVFLYLRLRCAAPVWFNSAYTKHVDVALNEAVRIVSGCLTPTPTEEIYPIVGIAPPTIRRRVAAEFERKKQETDHRHPLYGHQVHPSKLKSRNSFIQTTTPP